MRLPDFLIVGAAKSGTTTLYEYLCRHPDIFMSTPKEPEFFARDENYARGIEWYSSLFNSAQPQQICGEASTIYTRSPQFPHTAARIARHIPHAKLIYIMRHPVDRAYSHYVQCIKTAQNKREQLEVRETFEDWIQRDTTFIDSSKYLWQIERYLPFFPRESFLFLTLEDLIENRSATLMRVFQFLGVNATRDSSDKTPIAANQAQTHVDWFVRSRMTAPLKSIPGLMRLASWLPQDVRDLAYQLLKRLPYRARIEQTYVPAPMLLETRHQLIELYREPNRLLGEFLDRDFSRWDEEIDCDPQTQPH